MRWIASLLLMLVLAGCCCQRSCSSRGFWEKRVLVEPLSKAMITYAVKLKNEKGLRFEDSNIFYDEHVDVIRMVFSTQAIIELKEARELLVDVVENLIKIINEDPLTASQFEFGEMTSDNVELYISFESYFTEYVDQEYIAWISLFEGISRFYAGLIKYPYNDYWHARTEPYYKSVEFVTYQREAESAYEISYPPKKGLTPVYDVLIQ